MKAFRKLLFFVFGSAIVFFILGWYSGFFARARVEIRQVDSFVVVYENHTGAYSETMDIQERIADQLWDAGVDNYFNFGVFYDDPENTRPEDLRSMVGRVVTSEHEKKIMQQTDAFLVQEFSHQKAAVVELPLKNIFSLYAAVYKAYPLLDEYARKHNVAEKPVIEVYKIPGNICVILPLDDEKLHLN